MTHNVEAIRSGLNLVTLAEDAGAELRLARGEWRGACPIHHGDNKSGFVIYEKDGNLRWKCYTSDCGQGDEFNFIMALTGKNFAQVLDDLDGGGSIPATKQDDTERRLRELEKKLAQQERRLSELEKWQREQPWERYHQNAPESARQAWRDAGIPDEWQRFYKLGGTQSFNYASGNNFYTSPTLTIPVYERGWNCVTLRHRLLSPEDKNDKYRPDMPGLGSHPFLCDPDLGFDAADKYIVVEGEKKAMVTFLTLDTPLTQVIGIPGKGIWKEVALALHGKDVTILLDHDAQDEAGKMAREIGGAKIVRMARKIDDVIVTYGCSREWVNGLLMTGKKVV